MRPPAFFAEIDTPALILDLAVLERNISRMQAFFEGRTARLRPHFKTHKCPQIAHKQLAAGAKGITCAKVGEAEVLVAAGVKDILIANQIVGPAKLRHLMRLARHASVTVCVDDPRNVEDLEAAARAAGSRLGVLVEVDTGMKRCGVKPGKPVVELARRVRRSKHLEFLGLQGYEGHVVLGAPGADKDAAAGAALRLLDRTRRALLSAGLPCREVSGGGTGTYKVSGASGVMTEIQAGSYATMDARYGRVTPEFEPALFCLATVISRTAKGRAVGDAGLKAITTEFGMPEAVRPAGVSVDRLSEEHTLFRLTQKARALKPGDKVLLLPSHGCTTFNLHDEVYGVRGGRLECRWDIAARGKTR